MGACWETLGITEEALERQSLDTQKPERCDTHKTKTQRAVLSDTDLTDVFSTLLPLSMRVD